MNAQLPVAQLGKNVSPVARTSMAARDAMPSPAPCMARRYGLPASSWGIDSRHSQVRLSRNRHNVLRPSCENLAIHNAAKIIAGADARRHHV